jgi:ABC-type antimicrobial peptide transport system permease subunit
LPLGTVTSRLRSAMRTIDADLPLFDPRTVDDRVAYYRWGQRFTGSLLGAFAGIALLLAAVGLYAITAYSTTQRTREIGIRMALGATVRHVWWLVTRGAVNQMLLGVAIGVPAAVGVVRLLPTQFAGVSGPAPGTFAWVAVVMVIIGVLASFLPGRRASRMHPVAALRCE